MKARTLLNLANEYNLNLFVETGTHSGGTVNAMRGHFKKIYSIELSDEFYKKAAHWFRNDTTVTIVHGDSAKELLPIVQQLTEAALFWLDGHYSEGKTARGEKDTPIMEELEHIYTNLNFPHVVVIDDARAFGTDPEYPTIAEIEQKLKQMGVAYQLQLRNDAIRILPTQQCAH